MRGRVEAGLPVFLDGGMGSMINAAGVDAGRVPERLCETAPDLIRSIHAQYAAAGSHVATAHTFGAAKLALRAETRGEAERLAAAAVRLAKESGARYAAIDLGPAGELLSPLGGLDFEDAVRAFAAVVRAGADAGADLAIIETMADLHELKAALLAVRETAPDLPVIATATFQPSLRTLTGADCETVAAYVSGLRADALGFNCGGSLEDAVEIASSLLEHSDVPVVSQPNAGLPSVVEGRAVYKTAPDEFAAAQTGIFLRGARILGGCCGTTPAHIEAMVRSVESAAPAAFARPRRLATRICSGVKTLSFGNFPGGPGPAIVGERINPTGKKKFQAALLAGNTDFILGEADAQISAGAHALDVNTGMPGIDESQVLPATVRALQAHTPVPLQIDTSAPDALEAALRAYDGIPLVNSVNGKKESIDAVIPLVAKYGGVLVALCLDEEGIPETPHGRVEIAERLLEKCKAAGIPARDVVFDALTLAAASIPGSANATLDAMREIKSRWGRDGAKTALGVSNISFGLPARALANGTFLAMALREGLDAAIVNPQVPEMAAAFRAYCALAGFDADCAAYCAAYAGFSTAQAPSAPAAPRAAAASQTADGPAPMPPDAAAVRSMLAAGESPSSIIDSRLVPALDRIGRDYAAARVFLPELLRAAKIAEGSFAVLKEALAAGGEKREPCGRVAMCTVEGDVHDIGKNIVIAMLENYGYEVDDFGKDVKCETVVENAISRGLRFVGLSALMTTTVPSMEKTISLFREAEKAGRCGHIHVCVGGAVLTAEYAKGIGADSYAADAMETVRAADGFFGVRR